MAAEASTADQIYRLVASAFDASFYRAIYVDVAEAGFDPVRHYVESGWREGRDPAPWFSTSAYVDRYPDASGVNPFHHYLTRGWREGRTAEPSEHGGSYLWRTRDAGRAAARPPPPPPAQPIAAERLSNVNSARRAAEIRAQVSKAFDAEYYCTVYADVAASGDDPLDHFLGHGWREGRNPNPTFSTRDYLELNPDVAASGVNPFVHFLTSGDAGRQTREDLGFRQLVIARLIPMADRLDRAQRDSARFRVRDAGELTQALADRRAMDGALHVTFSHDDFSRNVGGVQLCLQREAAAIAELGRDHLHLYPLVHWPTLRPSDRPAPIGVLWNGRDLGAFEAGTVIEVLAGSMSGGGPRSFALHSLLGHDVEEVLAILAAAGLKRGYFWLHDFTSLCAGFHLMRNDVADCGAPPPTSGACGVCIYGPWRAAHVEGHARLFKALDLTVVAPSAVTYKTWRAASAAPAKTPHIVHPHARLEPRGAARVGEAQPLTVAFLGMPAVHKGWPIFAALAERFSGDERYRFLHLAAAPVPGAVVEFHQVAVSADQPGAMREALDQHGVDVALIWSLCRETFSFTAYEAVAVGAAVVTGPDSGNVAAFVAEGRHGLVLPDEAALSVLFESGEALKLSRAVRQPPAFDLVHGALTVDLLEAR